MRITIPALAAALLADPAAAAAHALLLKSDPPVGGTVQAAPSQVAITFSEAVEPNFSTITVTDPAGTTIDRGDVTTLATAKTLAVSLKPIGPGTYHVVWHAISVDTHRTEGAFDFKVAP